MAAFPHCKQRGFRRLESVNKLTVNELPLGRMRAGADEGGGFLDSLEEELRQIDEEIILLEADKKRQSLSIDRELRVLKKNRRALLSTIADAEELNSLIERNLGAG